tara:strand:- start:145 stop:339 length:195 start_codon:yes stop_codon:yes gene_type:complete
MEDIVDLIATDASASDIQDRIKDALMAKAAERIEAMKPTVANSFFNEPEQEVDTEVDTEEESEE